MAIAGLVLGGVALLINVIVTIFIGALFSTASDEIDRAANGERVDDNTEPVAVIGLNEAARDGDFEFTVSGLECGDTTVGSEFLQEEAQGQFCKLNVTVENIGTEAQTLFADDQYLFTADDTRFSASSTATIYNSPDNLDSWLTEINPGNTAEGAIVFDVPADAEIDRAELHDSALSGGVEVTLQ